MTRFRLGLLALALVPSVSAARAPAADRTNFLFIYTDDQRWDALGAVQKEQGDKGRFPFFKTPNLDRLAAEGVRFRNAFVTMSLCAPSRAAFLTGRYNHLNGIANNHTPFPEDAVTHASVLGSAGYATGYVGKWHMGGQRGQRPGFTWSASFIGQGRYFDCPFEVNGNATPTKGWVDDVSTDYAIEFIRSNKDKPFSLVLGYKSCHGPWEYPERAKDRFPDADSRPVPNLEVEAVYKGATAVKKPGKEGGATRSEMHRNYFRTLSAMDDAVGRLLAALDETGLAANTVVVFAGDNGYYLGEHGLGDKRSAYDEALRIPLLLRWPKLAAKGRTVDEMVLNIDLAPTLIDLAGLPVPEAMQGKSWKPLLEGKPGEWRKAFFYEYFREKNFGAPTVFAVRTETAKLIKYLGHDEWTELFDLAADPYETKNLAMDPGKKELLDTMLTEFDRQAKTVDFRVPDYADRNGPGAPAEEKPRPRRKNP
jgi:arylsulfatase A-like enzyme